MKYATFKDFVQDAFYHGVDMMELDIDFKVDESGHTLAEPNIWRTTLHRQINTKDFDAAEIWLHAACNSITIPGVCSWLPDKAAMDEAYRLAPIQSEVTNEKDS